MQRWTRRAVGAATLLMLTSVAAIGWSTGEAQPASAAPVGCGYADTSANNGTFASTICWFDFTSFDETQARSAAGQAMQVTLDGGYVATFTVHFADVPGFATMSVERRSTPLETRFAFGTDAYRGVPGLDTLYSFPTGAGVMGGKLTIDNIQIVDSLGAAVSGYSFVAADTEDNVAGESFEWTSDKPLNEIERLAPAGGWGCKSPVGLGTTDVSCAGTGAGGTTIAGGKSTALLVAADTPTTFATEWITGARSGLAVGIQTAKLTLVKQVAGRVGAADSFTVAIKGSTGTTLDSATTGTTATSATTSTLNVLAGEQFTLSDAAAAGSSTNLANYDSSWSCTNVNASSTTVLPSGSALSKTVTPAVGDDITCTVTNTAKVAALTLVKSVSPSGAGAYRAGQVVGYSFMVTNTGAVTIDNVQVHETAFSGHNALGPISCPAAASTLDPGEPATCTASYTLTQQDVDAGTLTNSAQVSGDPVGFPAGITSNVSTATLSITADPEVGLQKVATRIGTRAGQGVTFQFAVTNLGNVPLSDPVVTEGTFTGTGVRPAPVCPTGTIQPDETVTCTATYILTQADIDARVLSNTASVSATAPGGAVVSDADTVVVTIPDPPIGRLATTGTTVAVSGGVLALGLLIGGATTLVLRRKQLGRASGT